VKKQPAKVTSHEVAAAAGVSRSAVSRTFTPGASVAPRTREKVLAAAGKLGYRPNALARSLIVRRTQLIGLVMAEWENPFYTRMLRLFSERLQAEGYQLVLLTSNTEADADDAVRRLLQYQVDGVIVVSARPSDSCGQRVRCQRNASGPGQPADGRSPHVQRDLRQPPHRRDIVALLAGGGYRRFALLRGDPTAITGVERTDAILTAA
jgi:DNA-binding LacI/PurR family transcriptional regulator